MKPEVLVAKAAKALDRLFPRWYKRVKLTKLDLAESDGKCSCVTAQLGLGWDERSTLPKLVRAATGWSLIHDGNRKNNSYHDPYFFDADRIGQYDLAWRHEIRKRRAAA